MSADGHPLTMETTMTHPHLTDGDPESQDPSRWSTDDLLETAETLAAWHEGQSAQAAKRTDSSAVVEHQAAANLIRELMGRVPPFPLAWSTPWEDGNPVPGQTVVEIAGHRIERKLWGVPWVDHRYACDPVSRAILEACERDHDNERSESDA